MTLVLWLIGFVISVGVLVFAIRKGQSLIPFAAANMAARQDLIAEQLAAAEASEKRLAAVRDEIAGHVAEARAQANDIVVRARQEAKELAAEIDNRGAAEAAAQLVRAQSDIAIARDRAVRELREETARLVVDASGRVLAKAIDDVGHRRLIDESLDQVAPIDSAKN